MRVWGVDIPDHSLDLGTQEYLFGLPMERPSVEWVWREIDRIWYELGLNNSRSFSHQYIREFYSHPVWTMNGIFTMSDPVSLRHRRSLAAFLKSYTCSIVADYGGGFGTLAHEIVRQNISSSVYIVEPYPTSLALALLSGTQCIKFIADLSYSAPYDVVIAQDVLEHVDDPVGLAFDLASVARPGGLVIFANCFYPVIQCHLPRTFHLRHTFPYVMQSMGLEYLGRILGVEHALAFRKRSQVVMNVARKAELLSKVFGPLLNMAHPFAAKLYRLLISK